MPKDYHRECVQVRMCGWHSMCGARAPARVWPRRPVLMEPKQPATPVLNNCILEAVGLGGRGRPPHTPTSHRSNFPQAARSSMFTRHRQEQRAVSTISPEVSQLYVQPNPSQISIPTSAPSLAESRLRSVRHISRARASHSAPISTRPGTRSLSSRARTESHSSRRRCHARPRPPSPHAAPQSRWLAVSPGRHSSMPEKHDRSPHQQAPKPKRTGLAGRIPRSPSTLG